MSPVDDPIEELVNVLKASRSDMAALRGSMDDLITEAARLSVKIEAMERKNAGLPPALDQVLEKRFAAARKASGEALEASGKQMAEKVAEDAYKAAWWASHEGAHQNMEEIKSSIGGATATFQRARREHEEATANAKGEFWRWLLPILMIGVVLGLLLGLLLTSRNFFSRVVLSQSVCESLGGDFIVKGTRNYPNDACWFE